MVWPCKWQRFIHFDKYTSRCISASCKNAMYPFIYVPKQYSYQFQILKQVFWINLMFQTNVLTNTKINYRFLIVPNIFLVIPKSVQNFYMFQTNNIHLIFLLTFQPIFLPIPKSLLNPHRKWTRPLVWKKISYLSRSIIK